MSTNKTTNWTDLLEAVARDPHDGKNMLKLSSALAYSVLRKTLDPQRHGQTEARDGVPSDSGQSPVLLKMKGEIYGGVKIAEDLQKRHDMVGELTHNKDGDPVFVSGSETCGWSDHADEWVGDGMELVQEAGVAIAEELRKQAERDPGRPLDLTRPYTLRKLKKCVRIKEEAGPETWEEVETTPIQEAFRAVRRVILNGRHVSIDPRNGYLYIAELVKDEESGEEETVYNRLPRYYDMGTDGQEADPYIPGSPAGLDGRPMYSADPHIARDMSDYVSMLNLSDREAVVMRHRLQGHGRRAIATAMGVRDDTVKTMQTRIRAKAKKVGLIAEAEAEAEQVQTVAERRIAEAKEAVRKVEEAEERPATPENIFRARVARADLDRIASRAEGEAVRIADHILDLFMDGKKKEQKQAEKALEIEMEVFTIATSI